MISMIRYYQFENDVMPICEHKNAENCAERLVHVLWHNTLLLLITAN